MPRYFFNLADGVLDLDAEGYELPGLLEARTEAVVYAASVLRHRPEEVWAEGTWRVEVTDERGSFLFAIVVLAVETVSRPNKRPRRLTNF